jgi:hypothetical protein
LYASGGVPPVHGPVMHMGYPGGGNTYIPSFGGTDARKKPSDNLRTTRT